MGPLQVQATAAHHGARHRVAAKWSLLSLLNRSVPGPGQATTGGHLIHGLDDPASTGGGESRRPEACLEQKGCHPRQVQAAQLRRLAVIWAELWPELAAGPPRGLVEQTAGHSLVSASAGLGWSPKSAFLTSSQGRGLTRWPHSENLWCRQQVATEGLCQERRRPWRRDPAAAPSSQALSRPRSCSPTLALDVPPEDAASARTR